MNPQNMYSYYITLVTLSKYNQNQNQNQSFPTFNNLKK